MTLTTSVFILTLITFTTNTFAIGLQLLTLFSFCYCVMYYIFMNIITTVGYILPNFLYGGNIYIGQRNTNFEKVNKRCNSCIPSHS